MLPCINKKILGVDCLGCGMQRSISLLLQGEFTAAFYMYPAIYPLLLLLMFLGFNFFLKLKYGYLIKTGLMITTVLTIIVSYIIKMKIIFN
ncbi:DUF2752 domain-containing protein [Aquimarina sp. 2304DJ70-9]|uniref:DUF2752 domain-containing protein n=1 Tax=Aquimarina penaris TaxID=3231044 RepID=UPI003461BD71